MRLLPLRSISRCWGCLTNVVRNNLIFAYPFSNIYLLRCSFIYFSFYVRLFVLLLLQLVIRVWNIQSDVEYACYNFFDYKNICFLNGRKPFLSRSMCFGKWKTTKQNAHKHKKPDEEIQMDLLIWTKRNYY